ncbi:hypothetical protein AsACE_CH01866 [Acinetobacter schindleri]|uniref:hypothetical protein n=1 Tax=Acinetobacter schindleri TaxID=108981 RepID=UPI0009729CB6|nr:hypothetical protein AsACE_CH01866 [Acinetobacter schindleri]
MDWPKADTAANRTSKKNSVLANKLKLLKLKNHCKGLYIKDLSSYKPIFKS